MARSFLANLFPGELWSLNQSRAAWSLLLLGAFGDVVTTRAGLAIGAQEANPVAAPAVETAGLPELAVLKAVAIGVVVLAWAWADAFDLPAIDAIPASLGALWVAIAVWNTIVLAAVAA